MLTKGLSVFENKILTLSEKIKKNLRNFSSDEINISAVKGPCLASGLANKMRTGAVLANENINIAKDLSSLIATDYYSIEITSDINNFDLNTVYYGNGVMYDKNNNSVFEYNRDVKGHSKYKVTDIPNVTDEVARKISLYLKSAETTFR